MNTCQYFSGVVTLRNRTPCPLTNSSTVRTQLPAVGSKLGPGASSLDPGLAPRSTESTPGKKERKPVIPKPIGIPLANEKLDQSTKMQMPSIKFKVIFFIASQWTLFTTCIMHYTVQLGYGKIVLPCFILCERSQFTEIGGISSLCSFKAPRLSFQRFLVSG